VGFTSPGLEVSEDRLRKAREVLGFDRRPLVFFQISGPDATKKRFIDIVLRSVGELSSRYKVVVSMGYLGGSGEPRKLADGAILYDWCPIKDEFFALSTVLVGRSGHRTIGQCIDAGKPAVLVPIHNHSEQLGNAEKFQSLGLGIAFAIDSQAKQSSGEKSGPCTSAADPACPPPARPTCAAGRRWSGCSRGGRARWRARRRTGRSWPSIFTSSRRSCRPTRCPTGTPR
jgi:hypothetical protein